MTGEPLSGDGHATTRELVRTALLAAACAALGYLLAGVPNVELISAGVFTSGALLGVRRGALCGGLAEAIYAGVNPNGISQPVLYAAQVLGFVILGAAGGALRPLMQRRAVLVQTALAAVCGFVLTLVYDLLTNAAVWVTARENASLAAIVVMGLSFPFPLAHPLGNTIGFALMVPAVLRATRAWSGP
jgi:hypothetical protein